MWIPGWHCAHTQPPWLPPPLIWSQAPVCCLWVAPSLHFPTSPQHQGKWTIEAVLPLIAPAGMLIDLLLPDKQKSLCPSSSGEKSSQLSWSPGRGQPVCLQSVLILEFWPSDSLVKMLFRQKGLLILLFYKWDNGRKSSQAQNTHSGNVFYAIRKVQCFVGRSCWAYKSIYWQLAI